MKHATNVKIIQLLVSATLILLPLFLWHNLFQQVRYWWVTHGGITHSKWEKYCC